MTTVADQESTAFHVARYGLSVAAVGLGFSVRWLVAASLGTNFPYLLFYPAIMLAARFGGLGPGIVSTLLSTGLAAFFYMEPTGTLFVTRRVDQVSLPIFLAFGLLITWSSESLRKAERRQRDLAALATERAAAERATAERLAVTRDELVLERKRVTDIVRDIPGVVWQAWGDPGSPAGQRMDFVSEYAYRLLGYESDAWLTSPNFWLSIVHPDDRDRAMREAHELYQAGFGGVIEFRWVGRDGRDVWVESHVRTIQDGGTSIGMRGVALDVSARKQLEVERGELLGAGAGIESRERRVHGDGVTRTADAHQRGARLDADVARRHPRTRARRSRARSHRSQRHGAEPDDRRPARRVAHHVGQVSDGVRSLRSRHAGTPGRRRRASGGGREGRGARIAVARPGGRRRPPTGRSAAPRTGDLESALERRQVHTRWRPRADRRWMALSITWC